MDATKGVAPVPDAIGIEGQKAETTCAAFSLPSGSRQAARQEWRDRAIETLAILRQRFPACFAPARQEHRWPLKVGVHRDIEAVAPDLTPAAIGSALSFYVRDDDDGRSATDWARRPSGWTGVGVRGGQRQGNAGELDSASEAETSDIDRAKGSGLETEGRVMTETSSSSLAGFVAAQLRVEALGAKLFAAEIESVIVALVGNFISVDCAIQWANEAGFDITTTSSEAAWGHQCGAYRSTIKTGRGSRRQ